MLRLTARNPGFTAISALTLALGLGGCIALFGLIHSTLIEPLPYPEAGRLVYFDWQSELGSSRSASGEKFLFWRDQSRSFEAISANELTGAGTTLVGRAGAEYVRRLRVSAEFFQVLGVSPLQGRGFVPGEDPSRGSDLVVLSYGLWQRRFDADPELVGGSVRLGDSVYEVVGVMPESFHFEPEADVWTLLPLDTAPRGGNLYQILGRLEGGVSLEQAQSETDRLFALSQQAAQTQPEERGVLLGNYKELIVGDIRSDLLLLFCGAGLVFLICCINLSNLVMARMLARAPEINTFFALGARWRHILRELFLECSAIAVLGGTLGWALARVAVPLALARYPDSFPRSAEVQVGAAAALFAALLALGGLVSVALFVATRTARENASRPGGLANTNRTTSGQTGRTLRRAFVVIQIALSLAVLVSTAAVGIGLLKLNATKPGFEIAERLTFQLPLEATNFRSAHTVRQFSREFEQRLRQHPGVAEATLVSNLPLETGLNIPLRLESQPGETHNAVEYRAVTPSYFRALGIPTMQGRDFTESDREGSQSVAIVNQALARLYGEEREILGQNLWLAEGVEGLSDGPRTVVGVVGDTRDVGLGMPPVPTVFIPQEQVPDALAVILYRSFPLSGIVWRESPETPWPDLRRILSEQAPEQAVANIRPMSEVVEASTRRQRFYALLLGLVGGLALTLTALGVYGVTMTQVTQRRREMGLRIVFGADSRRVLKTVLRESFVLYGLGLILGTPIAFAFLSMLGSLIHEIEGVPLLSFGLVALLLGVVMLVASYAPARLASKVDPAVLLRSG